MNALYLTKTIKIWPSGLREEVKSLQTDGRPTDKWLFEKLI